jgi:nicotinamidase/pyrazinamidase
MKNILLIVDPQNDFITGTLPVEGAEERMKKLAEYIEARHAEYDYILITMDSHPEDHCSFKENGGIWPRHCVTWSDGWSVPDYLDKALKTSRVTCYHKGTVPNHEEYSIFNNEEDGFVLANQLRELIEEGEIYVDICGIAGDYCVLETLKGLRKFVPDECISILFDFTASIDGGEKLLTYAKENQINIIEDSSINLTEYVR